MDCDILQDAFAGFLKGNRPDLGPLPARPLQDKDAGQRDVVLPVDEPAFVVAYRRPDRFGGARPRDLDRESPHAGGNRKEVRNASMAMREVLQQANPVILEPVMDLEVVVPEQFTGDVISDLGARHAQIEGMALRGRGYQAVRATVPLARMFGYATDLRSLTQGRGTFTMEFNHYAPVSDQVMERLTGGWRR